MRVFVMVTLMELLHLAWSFSPCAPGIDPFCSCRHVVLLGVSENRAQGNLVGVDGVVTVSNEQTVPLFVPPDQVSSHFRMS